MSESLLAGCGSREGTIVQGLESPELLSIHADQGELNRDRTTITNINREENHAMCFCELNGNELSFTLQTNWKATVQVTCQGGNKKRVDMDWDIPGAPVESIDSCEHSSGNFTKTNPLPNPVTPVVTLFFGNTVCDGGLPANLPATQGQMLSCNEGTDTMTSTWKILCPNPQQTLNISVLVEKNPIGGS